MQEFLAPSPLIHSLTHSLLAHMEDYITLLKEVASDPRAFERVPLREVPLLDRTRPVFNHCATPSLTHALTHTLTHSPVVLLRREKVQVAGKARVVRRVFARPHVSHCGTTALLHYYTTDCTIALLHYCTTTLLHYYTTLLLHYYTTLLLHYYTTALLHYCITTLLHYYTTALLHYYYFLPLHCTAHLTTHCATASLLYSTHSLTHCLLLSPCVCVCVNRTQRKPLIRISAGSSMWT